MFDITRAMAVRGFRLVYGLPLCMAVALLIAPHGQAASAKSIATCSGVVKVSYGTFSGITVKGMTCGAAKKFVVTSGGVPRGWKCAGTKVSATTTIDKCVKGPESIQYHFVTK